MRPCTIGSNKAENRGNQCQVLVKLQRNGPEKPGWRWSSKPPPLSEEDLSVYRVLEKHEQVPHRGRARSAAPHPLPKCFTANGPNPLWSWDISYSASQTRGQHWHLYLIVDIYSRKIVAWEVHEDETGEHAKDLAQRALLREGCANTPPALHSDNEKHLHSGINFVTPASRHRCEDSAILKNRERVFEAAKAKHPRRWSGDTRDWRPVKEVSLNPGRAHEIELNKCAA